MVILYKKYRGYQHVAYPPFLLYLLRVLVLYGLVSCTGPQPAVYEAVS